MHIHKGKNEKKQQGQHHTAQKKEVGEYYSQAPSPFHDPVVDPSYHGLPNSAGISNAMGGSIQMKADPQSTAQFLVDPEYYQTPTQTAQAGGESIQMKAKGGVAQMEAGVQHPIPSDPMMFPEALKREIRAVHAKKEEYGTSDRDVQQQVAGIIQSFYLSLNRSGQVDADFFSDGSEVYTPNNSVGSSVTNVPPEVGDITSWLAENQLQIFRDGQWVDKK